MCHFKTPSFVAIDFDLKIDHGWEAISRKKPILRRSSRELQNETETAIGAGDYSEEKDPVNTLKFCKT